MAPFDRPDDYDFQLVFHCDHAFALYHYGDIVTYLQNLKRSRNLEHNPFRNNLSCVSYTCQNPSEIGMRHLKCHSFAVSGTGAPKFIKSRDRDHTHFRGNSSPFDRHLPSPIRFWRPFVQEPSSS